jgi:hypothetical protein
MAVAVRSPIARRAARSGASVTTWLTWYTHAIRSSVLARPVRIRGPAARHARRMSARQSLASLAVYIAPELPVSCSLGGEMALPRGTGHWSLSAQR